MRFTSCLLVFACASLASCNRPRLSKGEQLARTYCAACHTFPEPQLLNKETWRVGVLPQMAPRLGVHTASSFTVGLRSPQLTVLREAVSTADWESIVRYYLETAPDTLPGQILPSEPRIDPDLFRTGPLIPRMQSSAIITLLEADPEQQRIFVGEAGTNRLLVIGQGRRPIASLTLSSPPTDVIADEDHLLVLESGILAPNDEARGRLVQYDFGPDRALHLARILIDSLYRPVFVERVDLDSDGRGDFLICEYGDNRGRLSLYQSDGATYRRQILDSTPGAIRFDLLDMSGDRQLDIVALFAQGDERIVLFVNDGKGYFPGPPRILARFPPVYGSMHFSMQDFNGDGHPDILYVNGDNFDYSRVLKPYHGIRILENDGRIILPSATSSRYMARPRPEPETSTRTAISTLSRAAILPPEPMRSGASCSSRTWGRTDLSRMPLRSRPAISGMWWRPLT